MKRRWKIAIGVVAVLIVFLGLNALALSGQTKDAHTTVEGGQIVDTFGGKVQVTDSGRRDASPVVLLHGYASSLHWWDGMQPELERQHRVIRIDLLGHGGSEKPRNGYSVENQAATVASALSTLGVDHATVVGHAFGFTIATALAEHSPELVGRLVDIGEAPDDSFGSLPFVAKLIQWPLIGPAIYRATPDFQIRNSLKDDFAPGYNLASGFEDPDQIVTDVRAMTYSSLTKTRDAYEAFVHSQPLNDRLAKLTTPIPLLVIFGAEDQLADSPEESADAYKNVPGASIAMVDGSGHSPQVEKPVQTAALVLEFAANPGDEIQPGHNEFVPPNKQTAPENRHRGKKNRP
ncbi:MAG: alpha/beta fold hydrolase [Solirubrobacterales bacterium]